MDSLTYIFENLFTTDFFFTILRVTTPILLAGLAAVVANKAGVTNIALEGIMLTAALFGVIGSGYTNSLFIGLLSALLGGIFIALILAYFALYLDTNIILTGIALNLLTIGGTAFLLFAVSGDRGTSTNIKSLTFPKVDIPLIKDIPIIGDIFSGHNLITYLSLILVFLVYVFLNKTTIGLRFRAVGENPNAASSVGINVNKTKLSALILSGALASLGGAYMSMAYLSSFTKNMISGRGYIGLAAEAMGHSLPIGTLISSLIFGSAESISYLLQSLTIPAEIIRMMPYLATILGLIIYSHYKRKRRNKNDKT